MFHFRYRCYWSHSTKCLTRNEISESDINENGFLFETSFFVWHSRRVDIMIPLLRLIHTIQSQEGVRDAPPRPICFIFMYFWGKFAKMIDWLLHLWGWRPNFGVGPARMRNPVSPTACVSEITMKQQMFYEWQKWQILKVNRICFYSLWVKLWGNLYWWTSNAKVLVDSSSYLVILVWIAP